MAAPLRGFRGLARCLHLARLLRIAHLSIRPACQGLELTHSRQLSPPSCLELRTRAPHPATPFARLCRTVRQGARGHDSCPGNTIIILLTWHFAPDYSPTSSS